MKKFSLSLALVAAMGCLARTANECPQTIRREVIYILSPLQHTGEPAHIDNAHSAPAPVVRQQPREVREYIINTLTPLIPASTGYSQDAYPTVRVVCFPLSGQTSTTQGLMVQGYHERYPNTHNTSSYQLYSLDLVNNAGGVQINREVSIGMTSYTHDVSRSTVHTAIASFPGTSLNRNGSLCINKNVIGDICYRSRYVGIVCGTASVCSTTAREDFRAVQCTGNQVCLRNYFLRLDARGVEVDPITGLAM